MKASIAHHVRPTSMLLGKDSRKPYNEWDRALARAYQRFLNELCQQCGLPKYMCHTTDNRIQFRGKVDECEATAAAERKIEQLSGDGKKKLYGSRGIGEPYLTEEAIAAGVQFSDLRRPYMVEQAKIKGLLPEDFEL